MHVDYLNITVPETVSNDVTKAALRVLDTVGCVQTSGETYRIGGVGTFKLSNRNGYTFLGLSGSAIRCLYTNHQYNDYLWSVAESPHRVTSMDIAHDVECPTLPVLRNLWRRAHGPKGIRLTRKRVPTKSVRRVVRKSLYGEGNTGTIYLGSRKSEVHLRVYDKRNEALDNRQDDIGHDLTRYELTVTSKMGVSLSDAMDPRPIFWHFMHTLLPRPDNIKQWEPGGEGFAMPPREKLMAAERLKRTIEENADIDRWIELADEIGPNGRKYLESLLRRRLDLYDDHTTVLPDHGGTDEPTE